MPSQDKPDGPEFEAILAQVKDAMRTADAHRHATELGILSRRALDAGLTAGIYGDHWGWRFVAVGPVDGEPHVALRNPDAPSEVAVKSLRSMALYWPDGLEPWGEVELLVKETPNA